MDLCVSFLNLFGSWFKNWSFGQWSLNVCQSDRELVVRMSSLRVQHALKCTESRQTQKHTSCATEPTPTNQSTERWQKSGDRKWAWHYDGHRWHLLLFSLRSLSQTALRWWGIMGKWVMRSGCHAAARPFGATVTTVTTDHQHNITTVPRLEKHAPPFWASLLAAWSKERREGSEEGEDRGWRLKVWAYVGGMLEVTGAVGRSVWFLIKDKKIQSAHIFTITPSDHYCTHAQTHAHFIHLILTQM